jgi:hypothetical protein
MGGRVFYLRLLSPIERERLRVVALNINQRAPEKPTPTEDVVELADIFAGAAGMTRTELLRSVEIVETDTVLAALLHVAGFSTLPDGRIDFDSGVVSA